MRTFLMPLFAILFLGACGSGTPEPIRIGATMSETGNLSIQGIAARNGYLLCEQHLNAGGGVLGRPVAFTILDDASDSKRAVELYERLISEDGVDLIMGPYGSTLTAAVAPVTERHGFVHVSPLAATTSIWEQGYRSLFMVLPPAELFLGGLIDLAAENGFQSIAILQEDALFPRAAGDGAAELARERGMQVAAHQTYARGTSDFAGFLRQVQRQNVQVVGMAASTLSDFVRFVEQMDELGVSVRMFGTSGAVAQFQEALGGKSENTFGLSAWEPGLPNPGIGKFVSDFRERFGTEPSFHAAGAYGSCQILAEAIELAGTLDQETLRQTLLELDTQTIFSRYAVDERGYQIANTGLFIQWQDGRKVVVWPEELAEAPIRLTSPAGSGR